MKKNKNNPKTIVFLFMWLSVCVLAETDPVQTDDKQQDLIEVIRKEVAAISVELQSSKSRRLCGTALIRALVFVCSPDNADKNLVNEKPSFTKLESVYRQKRFKRGVVDECCRKTCDMHDLIKYCGIL